ncbi:MAG: c-type cytochrome, partial [Limisphaerales bacterium]
MKRRIWILAGTCFLAMTGLADETPDTVADTVSASSGESSPAVVSRAPAAPTAATETAESAGSVVVVHGNRNELGARIYREQCVSCHGANGEGVADKHDEPLYGERSLESLTKLIVRTMPEEKPEACV